MMFDRIISDSAVLGGKPCIKGTRISIEFLLELVATGATAADIVRTYPHLQKDDIEQALRYTARFLDNDVVIAAEVKR